MKKSILKGMITVLSVFLILGSQTAHADMEFNDYEWHEKLSRGVLNIVSSPIELARSIHVQSDANGAAKGWTVGLLEGVGRTFLRIGTGAVDIVTFPFDWPDDDKGPLVEPEYPWQKWDGQYL